MMTLDEMIEVLQAAKQGKTLECREHGEKRWTEIEPNASIWNFPRCDYRVKRQPRVIYVATYSYLPLISSTYEPGRVKFIEAIED